MDSAVPEDRLVRLPVGHWPDPPAVHEAVYESVDAEQRRPGEYLWLLWRYRWLCIACFGLVFGTTLAVTMLLPRRYMASTTIRVQSHGPIDLRLSESVLRQEQPDQILHGASVFTATQVAILKSRDLAERVIRSHRLSEWEAFLHPRSTARASMVAVIAGLLELLGSDGATDTSSEIQRHEPVRTGPDPHLVDRYMSYLGVRDVRSTELIEIRFTTPNARLSAFLAGAHVEAYKEALEEARLAAEVTAREFLQVHVGEAKAKLGAAEAALTAFARKHPNITLNQEEKVVAQRMAQQSELLTRAQGERIALETRHEFVAELRTDALHYFLDEPVVQKLRLALLQVGAEQAAIDMRLGPNHPRVQELRTQERALKERLAAEVGKQVASLEARLRAARLNEESLQAKLTEQEASAVELREAEAAYKLLEAEVTSSRALYDSLVEQQKETFVTAQMTQDNVHVVQRAEVPRYPARPSVSVNLALGLAAGLVFAVLVAVLCERFDDTLKDSAEAEGVLHAPALATVPNFALDAGGYLGDAPREIANTNGNGPPTLELVVHHRPRSVASEAFRVLRTAILYAAQGATPWRVILVTSSRPHEGKTVATLNLAVALGLSGARVLLIDADLRRPDCHAALGIDNAAGLSNVLTGSAQLEELIRSPAGITNVSVLPAGPPPANPAELLGSDQMRAVLRWARARYDFVLLDSPPALAVTDPLVLAREADGVLFVVKGQGTAREIVRQARDRLRAVGGRFVGIIVNDVDSSTGRYAPHHYTEYVSYRDHVSRGTQTERERI